MIRRVILIVFIPIKILIVAKECEKENNVNLLFRMVKLLHIILYYIEFYMYKYNVYCQNRKCRVLGLKYVSFGNVNNTEFIPSMEWLEQTAFLFSVYVIFSGMVHCGGFLGTA